ncbi:hypothetical protein [Actinoallomurus sp. CA-150999]|uniref:hypothetical protein n=1 Tax=Actinoallomurus sp. CA-150999 TaxID=3239887 RepID=UPI003D93EAD0
MNRHGDPHEFPDPTERDLEDGFEAVMESIERLTSQEIDNLKRQAESAEFGYATYALGLKLLELGERDQGEHWLGVAAGHGVEGAQRALDERAADDAAAREADQVEASRSTTSSAGVTRSHAASDQARVGGSDVRDRGAGTATAPRSVGGVVLPASHASLARGVRPSAPGTIFALALTGGITVGPADGRQILFGRNRPDVHVCLGADDVRVSRHHGTLIHSGGQWRVRNTGRMPIRIADRLLFPDEEPVVLQAGYTSIFVRGTRDHLLEVFVTGSGYEQPVARHDAATVDPTTWRLDPDERLVLVVLGQRYLLHEPHPQPLSWQQTADNLAELQPGAGWTRKRVERLVGGVRNRLVQAGVSGLTREEIGEPVGNTLNHNLIQEMLMSTTLVPRDLALIDAA